MISNKKLSNIFIFVLEENYISQNIAKGVRAYEQYSMFDFHLFNRNKG